MLSKILGGVSVALLVALFFVFRANGNLREDLGAAALSIEQAAMANASNLAAIESLQAGLNVCVEGRRVDEQQNQVVVGQLQRDLEELEAQGERVRIVREQIFRDPSCAELGSIDIQSACPALADSLLSSARSLSR